MTGTSVVLEPLCPDHINDLWDAARNETQSFTFLRYGPFPDRATLETCLNDFAGQTDQPFWAVRPLESGRVCGWLSLCDIAPADASIEFGSIWFAPRLQRTRAARDAVFLLM